MINFTPGREQDASPTIRGFKYQIQLTLQRWLDLAAGEVLYLECGEDVDRVLRAADSIGVQRELEQIKVRGRNVTLRSPSVLTALANFAAHLKANPNLSLRFRFTTTALPGREKLSPLGKNVKGIDAWQILQKKQRWTASDDQLLARLVELISSTSRPGDCPEGAWAALMGILGGTAGVSFVQFLTQFEWSCGSPSPDNLSAELMSRLGQLPGDTGPNDPARQHRYDQLIATLLELLSQAGEKKLTKELLGTALAKPTLTEHDRSRLKLLEEQSASLVTMLDSLQASMQRIGTVGALPILFGRVAAAFRTVDLSPLLPELPPLVARLARRTTTVDSLSQKMIPDSWLALHGDFGTGKSHLGFLIAERRGGVSLGVSMRGLSASDAANGLMSLMGNPATLVPIFLEAPGVILLDDLPDCEPQGRLEGVLALFAKTILSNGGSIISTSRRSPSENLQEIFGASLLGKASPSFSYSDANELFQAHQLPPGMLTETRVASMNAMCGGHPMLLTALARHLSTRPDNPDQALVEALVASAHRAQIDIDTSRAVLGTIEGEACRNLLYRLASAGVAMTADEIRSVAAVNPALAEPTGCIARLDGLWLRRNANGQFEVSPLATPLGREVPAQINKEIHSQVANLVFRRRKVSVSEFIRAITSLLIAGETESAAVHMLYGCTKWPNKVAGYADLGILLFFPPNGEQNLSPFAELPLRGAQAITMAIMGGDPQLYVTRIDAIIQNPTPEVALAAGLAGMMILTASLEKTPTRLAIFGASLVERFRQFQDVKGEMTSLLPRHDNDAHLLLPTACIHNWDDLDAFVEFLGSLPVARRQEVASMPEMKEGMRIIVFRSLFSDKGAITDDALARLSRIEDRCLDLGLGRLAAYAASGKLIIHGEYEKNLDRTLAAGARELERFASDPALTSIIEASLGQQLFLNKSGSAGLKHLNKGLADPTHIIGLERAFRLVDAISAAWEGDDDAGSYADELAQMLVGKAFTLPEGLCQMHAQVALVRWHQGRWPDAFAHYESAVVNFFELEDCVRTRQLGAGLMHAISYGATIAETGKPPPTAADGSPYAEGQPRMFSGTNAGMAEMWRARQGPAMLRWMLGRMGDALGLDEAASLWLDRALEAAVLSKSPALLMMLSPRATAAAVRKGAWADALEAAITHGRARMFLADHHQSGQAEFIEDDVNFDPLEAPIGRQNAQRAEEWSLWLLSRVLVSELCVLVVQSNDQSREALNAFADALGKVGAQSQLSDAWHEMTQMLRLAAALTVTDGEYKESLAESNHRGFDSARFVAHGLGALRSDARLKQAAVSHAGVLHKLSGEAEALGVSLDVYANAVISFWEEALARAAFQFTSPRELAKTMASAPASPPLLKAKAILKAVLIALEVSTSDETRTWINTP